MATGNQGFDEGGLKRYNVVGASDACNGTDAPRRDLNENERATSGSDNFFVLKSVDDLTPSEYPSKVKSGPVLREHWKPSGLLSVGRSRLGFPDCHHDHLVQLLACKNQHTREALDITGLLDVTVAVSYDGAPGSSLNLPDYQCKRIKSKTKSNTNGSTIGVIGYLFRFHEPVTKYKVSFYLNAIPPKRKENRRSVKPEHTACETICQISVTLETGPMTSSKSDKTKKKTKESTVHVSPLFALSPPSLSKESTVLYKRSWWVLNQLRSCRANAKWEDFDELASDLLLKFTDKDTQIAIKLEQGMNACYQNQPDRALQFIDEAFSFMCEAKNPQLMACRGYFYQAEILTRQGSLGKAENCLNLAGQNIAAYQTSPDTSLVVYGRARMLIKFIGCTPHRSLKQVKEAQSILEKCIDVCLHVESSVETESSYLNAMKQLFIIALHEMTILLLDCDSDVARKRIVSKECIATAQWCLHLMRNKYWSEVTQGNRILFYLGSSDLEYRRSNYADAEEFARLAKDKAMEMGFKLEVFKAQERLDFMRAITRGYTINNGPQQSKSDHEGENADISSTEAESDWLTELLN